MVKPLTYGDTFTLPSTGEDIWIIQDMRPVSYLPPENLMLLGQPLVAQATGPRIQYGFAPSYNLAAHFKVGSGWDIYDDTMDPELKLAVLAELDALDVHLDHRTDDEWREMHFDDLRNELEQALSTTMLGVPNREVTPHPLVSDEEIVAFAVAAVAEIASKRAGTPLFDLIYRATIEQLHA